MDKDRVYYILQRNKLDKKIKGLDTASIIETVLCGSLVLSGMISDKSPIIHAGFVVGAPVFINSICSYSLRKDKEELVKKYKKEN